MASVDAAFRSLRPRAEQILLEGAGRGVEALKTGSSFALHRQAKTLLKSRPHVALLTGFPIITPSGVVFENDGPIGLAMLAEAFSRLDWPVAIISDVGARDILEQAVGAGRAARAGQVTYHYFDGEAQSVDAVHKQLRAIGVSHLIAIERPGRARDGEYYNMKGEPVSAYAAPADGLIRGPWTSAAYADGGNEIGMGKVGAARIRRAIKHGGVIASRTKVDFLTLAGVSNWGCFGLVAFLCAAGPDLKAALFDLLTPETHNTIFEAARSAGAVDGVTKTASDSVDGLSLAVHEAKLLELRELVAQAA